MPVLDEHRIAALAAIHDLCMHRFGYLQLEKLVAARWEGDVQESRFADGTHVVADFARQELLVNGKAVARPAGLD